ncbi:MAG: YciI family protein [Chitinophagales bacterium]|nr:YciI family protein [Chitinophagales bacterium]
MTEFLMIFRETDLHYKGMPKEKYDAWMQDWEQWIGGIAAQGRLASGGRLAPEGKVLKPGGLVTDGPFAEVKEMLGGYLLVKADTLDEAVTMSHGCPVLQTGGSVEIRPQLPPMNR